MGVALGGGGIAQSADRVDERVHVERLDRDVLAGRRKLGRLPERGCLDERLLERNVAACAERGLEFGRAVEGRHPEERCEPVLRVNALAILDLAVDRQRRAEMRVDAARALGLAGGEAQEPAVVEELPLRLQRIETGFLDAPRIGHARSHCPSASASSV